MPIQDIRFIASLGPDTLSRPILSHSQRITENEYLRALDTIKSYREQVDKDLKNLYTFDNSNEKEMIVLALRANDNKRKETANQLRISERTLYRKIKMFNIDNDIIYP
jgi:transcriptional regulator with PAS, ATPase and Fis domain